MRILYPSDPLDQRRPDETYAEEHEASARAGLSCSLFSLDDFEATQKLKPLPAIQPGDVVIYRGWMLPVSEYEKLHAAIRAKDATPLVSVEDYRSCHHLPGWYASCEDLTPQTVFAEPGSDYQAAVAGVSWKAYFVKDHVKSLTTTRGSVARNLDGIDEVVREIEKYRGSIEGGVCIREYEEFVPETEERYFVFLRKPYAHDDVVPALVQEISRRIHSPFYSVDTVRREDGEARLVELGDGQVSDRKSWSAEAFAAMLATGISSTR